MKITAGKKRKWILAVSAGLVLTTPAFALFGFDIVYDPTEVAQTIANLKQAIQIALTTKQSLAMMQANLKNFSLKTAWQTTKSSLMAEAVQNSYGETAGWNAALNTNSPGAAKTAWDMATLQVSPGTYLSGQMLGSSSGLSSLAMIETFDASSPACLNAVGQYRALEATNAAAQAALENDELDTSPGTNSEIEQLNLLNASNAQRFHEMQSQGALHACLVEQTTISNMSQRNAAASAINDSALAQQERAVNNANPAGESNTWQTYLP